MAKKKNYDELSGKLIELIGGKENVSYFTHCTTRLRFNLKDQGLAKTDAINQLSGVSGTSWASDQLQVIIGADVDLVYDAVCHAGGFNKNEKINENLDEPKQKKFSFNSVLEAISGAVLPIIPIIIATSFVNILATLLQKAGMSGDNGTIQMLTLVGATGMYFLPIFIGATAAKKFNTSMVLGMLIGAVMINPTYLTAVNEGTSLSLFGLPVAMVNYTSNFLPTLVAVAVMAPIEKYLRNHIPAAIKSIAVPFLTLLIMLPLTFCLIGPAASLLGTYFSKGVVWLYETFGFLGVGLLTAALPFLIISGMHMTLVVYAITLFTTLGYEPTVFVAGIIITACQAGICLMVSYKTRNAELKATSFAAFLTAVIGGTTEPALFGVTIRSKKTIYATIIGGFLGGCVAGLGHAAAYSTIYSSFWDLVAFIPGGTANLLWEIGGCLVAFISAMIFLYLTFKEEDFTYDK